MKTHRVLLPLVAILGLASCGEPATSPLDSSEELLARRAEPTRMYDLGTLGGAESYAWDINDVGVVVGTSETSDGWQHAFRWTKEGGMEDLGTLGGANSAAVGINKRGFIAGTSLDAAHVTHLVMWDPNGGIVDLGVPPGEVRPFDINDHNHIVGEYFPDGYVYEPSIFYWTPKLGFGRYPWVVDLITVGGMNNQGDVVGGFCCGKAEWLSGIFFLPRGQEFVDLGGGLTNYSAAATAINNRRVIVGWDESNPDLPSVPYSIAPFRWTPKRGYELLGAPDDIRYGSAYALNDRGEIVGGTVRDDGSQTAFHWAEEVGMVDIGPGYPAAINERSQIVGVSSVFGGVRHATLWIGTKGVPLINGGSGASQQLWIPPDDCFANPMTARSKSTLLRCIANK